MSDKPENGLKQETAESDQPDQIHHCVLCGNLDAGICHFVCNTFVKVIHLENNLNKGYCRTCQEVEQVENEETKNSPDADTGKNVEYKKQDQTGQDDANKKKADDGEKLKSISYF